MKKFVVLLLFFMFFFNGCAAAPFIITPIVTGIVYWKEGEAKKYYADNSQAVHRATIYALQELEYPIQSDVKNTDFTYTIIAGEKRNLKISIKTVKSGISEVKIRIDFMGNKPQAELLYSTIDMFTNTIEYDKNGLPTKLKK